MGRTGAVAPDPLPTPAEPAPAVLIVDDTPANLAAFSFVLEGEGYELVRASSGPEALKYALRRDFSAVLLDVRMPVMDGIETATFLRAGRCRHTPILFVSAYENTPLEVERGYLAGAIDYLFSPVDGDVLKRKVAAMVDVYQRGQQLQKKYDALVQENRTLRDKVSTLESELADFRRLKSEAPGPR